MRELRGWVQAHLSDFCDVIQGQSPPGNTYNSQRRGLPFFQGKADFGPINPIARVWCDQPTKIAERSDILISVRAPVGPTNVADQTCAIGRGLAAIRPLGEIPVSLVLYAIRLREHQLQRVATGSTFAAISGSQLRELLIPLPPLAEQRRIVAEIEKQFTRLDEAVRVINSAIRNVNRVQSSLLTFALRGLEARSADLQSERSWLDQARAAGAGKKTAPDPEVMPMNPCNWPVASLDQLTTRITSGSRDWSAYYGRGTGTFLLAQNIRSRKLDLSTRQSVDPPLADASRARSAIQVGDVLVTIVGANTGDVCAVQERLEEHYVCQSVALLRPVTPELTKYLTFYLSDNLYGRAIWNRYIYGAGRPHLSFDQLKKTPILVPPKDIMVELLYRMESLETIALSTERSLVEAGTRAARLRQAILSKAFSGQLVPQDPNDEPASILLERIRAGRGHYKPKTARRHAPAQVELMPQS